MGVEHGRSEYHDHCQEAEKVQDVETEEQENFKKLFIDKLQVLIHEDGNIGRMVTNVINVEKWILIR